MSPARARAKVRYRMETFDEVAHKTAVCGEKYQLTKAAAIRAAIRMGEQNGVPFDAYECPYCTNWWHIGHSIFANPPDASNIGQEIGQKGS